MHQLTIAMHQLTISIHRVCACVCVCVCVCVCLCLCVCVPGRTSRGLAGHSGSMKALLRRYEGLPGRTSRGLAGLSGSGDGSDEQPEELLPHSAPQLLLPASPPGCYSYQPLTATSLSSRQLLLRGSLLQASPSYQSLLPTLLSSTLSLAQHLFSVRQCVCVCTCLQGCVSRVAHLAAVCVNLPAVLCVYLLAAV